MTMSMTLNPETLTLKPNQGQATSLWRHWGWPACAALLVHGLALGTLMVNWAPVAPVPTLVPSSVSLTLMSAPMPMPPMPEPIIEPPPVTEPVIETPPAPEPVIDQAAIARERRAREQEHERAQERERQQMLERQQAEREQQQQELQRQQELAFQAEQTRMAAEQQALARQQVSQYLPISKIAPDYPRRALDRAIEGDCTVQYDVTPNGRVSQPSIVSCDDPMFERPSLRAAAAFRYEPHRVNGQAVTVPGVRNTFRYRIESR